MDVGGTSNACACGLEVGAARTGTRRADRGDSHPNPSHPLSQAFRHREGDLINIFFFDKLKSGVWYLTKFTPIWALMGRKKGTQTFLQIVSPGRSQPLLADVRTRLRH